MIGVRRSIASLACAVGISSAVIGGCFSERAHGGGPTGSLTGECRIPLNSPVVGATTAIVAIRGFAFQPEVVRVKAGTTVTWINCETEGVDAHTSTSNTALWQSPFLEPGATYSHTFGAAGSFDYHCVPHPFMRGIVVVE